MKAIRRIGVLLAISSAIFALCGACPFSNQLWMRPLVSNFDSRYVSANTDPMPFDSEKWKTGKARHRVAMAHDLVNQKLLEGKTRAELIGMLGQPDADGPGDEGTRWLLGYYAKGLFDESIWLELTIKDDGSATGAGIWMSWEDPRKC